ncbi:hypothetical protein B0H17DRAFT_1140963 [Mycena rosella]|uniref:Uncharacterized protein n=1 Tax=Mycena rosella TaxID=1033263 RepID=A0AAD7D0N9_MYCRO|nr:hypothetical protein B0H17DRAFT_1140963 [Mycena rosella]
MQNLEMNGRVLPAYIRTLDPSHLVSRQHRRQCKQCSGALVFERDAGESDENSYTLSPLESQFVSHPAPAPRLPFRTVYPPPPLRSPSRSPRSAPTYPAPARVRRRALGSVSGSAAEDAVHSRVEWERVKSEDGNAELEFRAESDATGRPSATLPDKENSRQTPRMQPRTRTRGAAGARAAGKSRTKMPSFDRSADDQAGDIDFGQKNAEKQVLSVQLSLERQANTFLPLKFVVGIAG